MWVADRLSLDILTQLQDPGHDRPGDLVDGAGEPRVVVPPGFRVEMEGHHLRLGDQADEGVAAAEGVVEEGERLVLGQGDQPEGQLAEFDGGFVTVDTAKAA